MTLNSGPIPKYYQLADILRRQITSGKLLPNQQLPGEESLSKTHNVSRGTVRQATGLLLDEGLLRREQGRGTFVASAQPETTFFTLTSFDEDMRRQNRQSSTQLLTLEVVPATANVAANLALNAGEPIIHIARLRLADAQPVVYETRYLAQSLCPGLANENLETDSVHHLLVNKYQIPLVKMTQTVEIGQLSTGQANLLQASPGASAFFVDRLTYTLRDGNQTPAVWFKAVYREDNYDVKAIK